MIGDVVYALYLEGFPPHSPIAFEVCAFAGCGYCDRCGYGGVAFEIERSPDCLHFGYVLRRHVATIEEARWLMTVPLEQARESTIGAADPRGRWAQ